MLLGGLTVAMIRRRNLVSLSPVTPEFTRFKYIQQISISTQVSLTMFGREGGGIAMHCNDQYSVVGWLCFATITYHRDDAARTDRLR